MNPDAPNLLPTTPEEAELIEALARRAAYKAYRKQTRPYRRAFRGVFTRREADRFVRSRLRMQTRLMEEATSGP